MSFVAVATIASAGIGLVGSGRSSSAQESATKRGIRSNEILTREERQRQDEYLEEQRADFSPWRESGRLALDNIVTGIQQGTYDPPRFDPDEINVRADPGYQFRVDEANKAIENSASARGGLFSGRQLRELSRYNQNMASQEYGNAYNRYADEWGRETSRRQNRFNMWNEVNRLGLNATARTGAATANTASTSANLTNNQNAYTQNAIRAGGDAQARGVLGGTQAVQTGLQNWLTYQNNQPPPPTPVQTNQSNYTPSSRWNNVILN